MRNLPLYADHEPFAEFERNAKQGTLWDLVKSHLRKEVINPCD